PSPTTALPATTCSSSTRKSPRCCRTSASSSKPSSAVATAHKAGKVKGTQTQAWGRGASVGEGHNPGDNQPHTHPEPAKRATDGSPRRKPGDGSQPHTPGARKAGDRR